MIGLGCALSTIRPTTGANTPLATEALRGAGAVLLNDAGRRFLLAQVRDHGLGTCESCQRLIHLPPRS